MSAAQRQPLKAVSLSFELEAICKLTEGASLLVAAARHGALPLHEDHAVAFASAETIIEHAAGRLRNVQHAIRGSLDPAHIRTYTNTALPTRAGDDPDVRLIEWSPAKKLEQAEAIARASRASRGAR